MAVASDERARPRVSQLVVVAVVVSVVVAVLMLLNWTYVVDNVTSSTLTSSAAGALWSLHYSGPEMAAVTAMLAVMIAVSACDSCMSVRPSVRPSVCDANGNRTGAWLLLK